MAGDTLQVAANGAFLSQFAITIFLAVSLKAMWNLMHAMQVLAYLRMIANWPANAYMMLESMNNAATLENYINVAYDEWIIVPDGDFENEEDAEELEEFEISYENMYLSLGIFGISLVLLFLTLGVYFCSKLCALRFRWCNKLVYSLKSKLFYSVWIRYMIEANLGMTHNCIFFLYISGGFDDLNQGFGSSIRIVLLVITVIWPFSVIAFLWKWRSLVDSKNFQEKYLSIYQGLKSDKFPALVYTPIFCIRRLFLVLTLLALNRHDYWLILAYNVIQSLYFVYIVLVRPHEASIHNWLECFNELCMIVVQYLIVFFISSIIDPED